MKLRGISLILRAGEQGNIQICGFIDGQILIGIQFYKMNNNLMIHSCKRHDHTEYFVALRQCKERIYGSVHISTTVLPYNTV